MLAILPKFDFETDANYITFVWLVVYLTTLFQQLDYITPMIGWQEDGDELERIS
jgi:hypothetical protein